MIQGYGRTANPVCQVNDIIRETLARDLNGATKVDPGDHDSIEGLEHLIDMEKVGEGLMRVFDKSKEDDARQAAVKERMADVLRMRYEDEMTLDDTARALGVTRERIRQIEAKALRILRHPTKSEEWREVL